MKPITILVLLLAIMPVSANAAIDGNNSLQMPSAIRGWNSAPQEAKIWAQTIIDWGATAVIIVAAGALLYYFVRGRFADQSGSIQTKNDSTNKMIEVITAGVVLIVALGFIWMLFWK